MRHRLAAVLAFSANTVGLCGCERLIGPGVGDPQAVKDLTVQGATSESVQLRWTQVEDGDGRAAAYLVAFGTPRVTLPIDASGALMVAGTAPGSEAVASVEGLTTNTAYEFLVVSFRGDLDSAPVFGKPSNAVSAVTEANLIGEIATVSTPFVGATTVTLQWTQVDDGTGSPANYAVFRGSPTVAFTGSLAGATEVVGTKVGDPATLTMSGLSPSTTYQFLVLPLRGRLAANPITGLPSDAVSATTTAATAATPFFSDDFDVGAKTSRDGFTWSSGNRVDVSSDRAFSGSYALRFRYGPDSLGKDSSSEQRFNMGRYLPEYWVDYMIYFPTNFVHRADSPNNNKFFMTWRDTYSDVVGGTWRIGYEYQGTTSTLRPMSSRWDLNSWTSSGLNHPAMNKPFIGGDGPIKLGQWNRIRLHFKAASSRTATDGVMAIWVNDQLFGALTTGKFHNFYDTPADAVLRNGYFMGWANSGFTELTYVYIDDVRFYDTNPGWQ